MPIYYKNTSLLAIFSLFVVFNWNLYLIPIFAQNSYGKTGPPRFKQNVRQHVYTYLGDNVKFKCTAIGRPQPKVHWYRDGNYLNYSYMHANPRFREKSMLLELRRVEVSDKGNWMCKVWNNEGYTMRNFTLHIVDLCDYFLNFNISVERIPDDCLCLWSAIANNNNSNNNNNNNNIETNTIINVAIKNDEPLIYRKDFNLEIYNEKKCLPFLEEIQKILKIMPFSSKKTKTTTQSTTTTTTTQSTTTTTTTTTTNIKPKISLKLPTKLTTHSWRTLAKFKVIEKFKNYTLNKSKLLFDDSNKKEKASKNNTTKKFKDSFNSNNNISSSLKPNSYSNSKTIRLTEQKNNSINFTSSTITSTESTTTSNNQYYSSTAFILANSEISKNSTPNIVTSRLPTARWITITDLPPQIFTETIQTNLNNQKLINISRLNSIINNINNNNTKISDDVIKSMLYIKSMLKILDPIELFDYLVETGYPDITHLLEGLILPSTMILLRKRLPIEWNSSLDVDAKLHLAKNIVAEIGADRKYQEKIQEELDDLDSDEDNNNYNDNQNTVENILTRSFAIETTTYISTVTSLQDTPLSTLMENEENSPFLMENNQKSTTIHIMKPDAPLISKFSTDSLDSVVPETTTRTTISWFTIKPPQVPPYFRQPDEQAITNLVLPAGRTLKLACKSGGQPEPQIIWKKNSEELRPDSQTQTGSLFKFRKWGLELEDATESDTGNYSCEVFNSNGTIQRHFTVQIQDRIRSRPIIVPNVLLNQTIDVGNPVNFTCQVVSDLVPHIVWIKLLRINDSYLKWDANRKQASFNFLDMSTIKKAQIFHNNITNRYTLKIRNVSMNDQGIYSCVAGNMLGMSMANATLTVNEFRPMTLPTENPNKWPISYTILSILSALLLLAFLILICVYLFFSKKFAKNRVQNLDKMSVRKKVVITKKPQKDGDMWSDLASSYAITVEPVISNVGENRHTQISSDDSPLSEYEVPTDIDWEIDRNRLTLVDVIGEGAFGEVWRGVLSSQHNSANSDSDKLKIPIAVKRLKSAANEKELIILVSEMQIFKCIGEHRNILKLVGCCTGLGPLLVVLELCPHGNLRDFLRKHRPKDENLADSDMEEIVVDEEEEENMNSENYLLPRKQQKNIMYQNLGKAQENNQQTTTTNDNEIIKNLTLRDLVRFATEIARGMEYLASRKIIHRDLAARNVLVADNYVMKISDFGLSRNVIYHDYYRKRGAGRLPIKWMAPEALEANVYTVCSDVWSYGILLWEIMTLGGTPYPSIAMPQLYNLLKEGYRMEASHNCPEEIYGVMVMCWQDKAELRPQFHTIANYFDWMLAETASQQNSLKSDDGETTDEGPYAVINPENEDSTIEQQQQRMRPLSAPGIMSFEAFALNATNSNSATENSDTKVQILPTSSPAAKITTHYEDIQEEEDEEMENENVPLLGGGGGGDGGGGGGHKTSITSSCGITQQYHSQPVVRKKNSIIDQLQNPKTYIVDNRALIPINNSSNCQPDIHLYTNTLANMPTTKFIPKTSFGNNKQHEILPNSEGSYFVDSAIGSPLWSTLEGSDIGGTIQIPTTSAIQRKTSYSNTLPKATTKKTGFCANPLTIVDDVENEYVNDVKSASTNEIISNKNKSEPSTATTTASSSTKSLSCESESSSSSSSSSKSSESTNESFLKRNTKKYQFPVLQYNNNNNNNTTTKTTFKPICENPTTTITTLPPLKPKRSVEYTNNRVNLMPKKSIASDNGVRLYRVGGETTENTTTPLFKSIGQQTQKQNFISSNEQPSGSGTNFGYVSGNSNSILNLKTNKNNNNLLKFPKDSSNKLANNKIDESQLHRSHSIDSRSSGHGGSSAMSSAEGLGVGDLCQIIEYSMVYPTEEGSNTGARLLIAPGKK